MSVHDALFRATFSVPARAADLLRAVLPAPVQARVDWSSLEEVSGGRIGRLLEERRLDLVLRARIDGRETLITFLVEHRSTPDRRMPLRALEYQVAIWTQELSDDPGARLTPIVPVIVHHGRHGWSAPRTVRELMALDPGLEAVLGDRIVSQALTIDDLARVPWEEIAQRRASALTRLVLGLLRDGRTLRSALELLTRWADVIAEALDEDPELDAVLRAFRYVSEVRDEDLGEVIDIARRIAPRAEEAMMTLADRLRAEGKAEGKAEGEAELVLRALTRRFGRVDADLAARVRASTSVELDAIIERLRDAPSARAAVEP